MRKTRAIAFGLSLLPFMACFATEAAAEYRLSILHINDQHSRIEPVDKSGASCSEKDDQAGKCFGGMARVKTRVDERRIALEDEGDQVLVLDAGDEFQGSPFFTQYKGKASAELLNKLPIDAMAVGNHEFDLGPKGLADFAAEAQFPLLSANTSVYFEPLLKNAISSYTIIDKGGEKIGIIGLTSGATKTISSPGDNVAFMDEISILKTVIAEVKSYGVNKIVILSHCGLQRDKEIAASLDEIDVIIGGQSHTLLANFSEGAQGPYPIVVKNPSGREVPIVQAGAFSKYLGELNLTFDDKGNVIAASGEPHLLDANVKPDEQFAARIRELAVPLQEIKNEIIGETAARIDGDLNSCLISECSMGNLVADAMLDHVKGQGITIALENGGALHGSIGAGKISRSDIASALPSGSLLATFVISGADLVTALENGVSKVEEGAGRFPQIAGLRFAWSLKGEAGKSRIKSVDVRTANGWAPIDPAKQYSVVTNDLIRKGGDGYQILAEKAKDAYDFGPALEEVVQSYLSSHSPYQPQLEGRALHCTNFDPSDPASSCLKNALSGSVTAALSAKEDKVAQEANTATNAHEAKTASGSVTTASATDINKELLPPSNQQAEPSQPVLAKTETAEPVAVEKPAKAEASVSALAQNAKPEAQASTSADSTSAALSTAEPVGTAEPLPEKAIEANTETAAKALPADQITTGNVPVMALSPSTPESGKAPGRVIKRGNYTVQDGDTLWSIATAAYGNGSNWKKIIKANRKIRHWRRLDPGTTIRIP